MLDSVSIYRFKCPGEDLEYHPCLRSLRVTQLKGFSGRRAPPCLRPFGPSRPSSAGRSFPQRPPLQFLRSAPGKVDKLAKGLCPDRAAQGVSPIFRASLVQTSASLRPFRSAFGSLSKGGRYPSPLRLATPAFARRRSACRYMPRMA